MAGPIQNGNFFWDKTGKKITVAANGSVDGPAVVTSDPDFNDPNNGIRMTVAEDGNSCEFQVDKDLASMSVTFTEPADDPSTPESETISVTNVFSASHSKATELSSTVTDIPRVEP